MVYETMCHGTSGHVAEQSMSFNGGKTIVQLVFKLPNQGTLNHAVAQWATLLNKGIPNIKQVYYNGYQLSTSLLTISKPIHYK